ncbi:MAG TPA: cinnamycin family lantibiotic [Pseudonocardiaceae bacterium]|nr:cinnamycin family lantibiotic [Pseudonocardiaceae bacterium]
MPAILRETATDLDEILYQSVVDAEFRAQLLTDPSVLGLAEQSFALPTPVEPQDTAGLDLASGDYYLTMCATSCSAGPFTVVCDGRSK